MTRVALQKTNTWDFTQAFIHVVCHRFTFLCLRRETLNADQRQRRRDLAQPELAAHVVNHRPIFRTSTECMWTATVDDRRSLCGKFRCSAQQNATLARGQSLGGLERGRTEVPHGACAAAVP